MSDSQNSLLQGPSSNCSISSARLFHPGSICSLRLPHMAGGDLLDPVPWLPFQVIDSLCLMNIGAGLQDKGAPRFYEQANVGYWQVFSLTSFALSLLMVFRTNSSYARWWEARTARFSHSYFCTSLSLQQKQAVQISCTLLPGSSHLCNGPNLTHLLPMLSSCPNAVLITQSDCMARSGSTQSTFWGHMHGQDHAASCTSAWS